MCRFSEIAGIDGRYVSIANGPIQESAPRTKVKPAIENPIGRGRSVLFVEIEPGEVTDIYNLFGSVDSIYRM